MSFFYDLNKKLDGIRATPEVTHQQLNERDMGKHNNATTGFKAVADKAAKEYGSKAAGERVAGAVKAKMAKAGKLEEEQVDEVVRAGSIVNPNLGILARPQTQQDRDSLAFAVKRGREANRMPPTDNDIFPRSGAKSGSGLGRTYTQNTNTDANRTFVSRERGGPKMTHKALPNTWQQGEPTANDGKGLEEGPLDAVKKIGKKVASGVNRLIGHGSDEDMRKDLQRKSGAPVTGKKPAVAPMHPSDEYDYFTGRDKVRGGEQQVKEKMSPAKQQSFAALAPPANKITFADKIAGAKKEVDEMLGDVAAEAMRGALSGGQKKLDKNHNGKLDANDFAMLRKGAKKGHSGEMDEENDFTAHQRPAVVQPKVGSVERGHKHDIKHTATGRMVTRRVDDQGNSVGADDASDAQAGPRGRGRPKGTKGAIGAKGPSGKSKLMTREGDVSTGNLQKMHQLVNGLRSYVQDPDGQAMLKELMSLVKHYVNQGNEKPVDEEKTSTRDDHAERAGKKVTKDIEYDEKKKDGITGKKRGPEDDKAEKAGKKVAKDIEYDEKKKKKDKEVDESTTSGSVATSTATKGGGGSMVGKGIYDSMNFELEQMIAESMSINMSDSTEGGKSLTITATDEDALKLGMMLKNAGLGGGDAHGSDMHSPGEEPCETCGMPDCGCGDVEQAVDENAPDWPTNTEQADNNFGYSGGLNKPKADIAGNGQSTVPVVATRPHNEDDDMRRMMEMAGIKQAELEPWEQTMKEDAAEEIEEAEEEVEEDFLESIQRMREIAGIREAKKPDFLDMDKDGDEEEPMSNAIKDKEEKKVDESIFALTNQWKAYKG